MPIIEVTELHKRYGDTVAVEDVSFTVEEGEIFGILGPNGAGKTTTVECIEGLRSPDAGAISVLGLDPRRDRAELRQRLGAQLQESSLPDKLTVAEALDLHASFYRRPADWNALLDSLHLADKRRARYRDLSGGQKQRLSIALALVGGPAVAVLDELTTGLDPQARRDTWDLIAQIRDSGVTIILVTHFMDEAQRLCDRLALVDAGRIAALDTPAGLIARAQQRQYVHFRASAPVEDAALTAQPEVDEVRRSGAQITVIGTGNLLYAVASVLARERIVAEELRVEQATLDDAFLALTGRRLQQ
ncbi:ABC transporter ATP-binding protein [Streptomonospora sp. PA3]|uniref:ABC transporter ATP-binding protein n=1 Tax=Streptomonospora sp. PA3 TaxID=2607326 RepID=UPI0012DE0B28|nr:ABC transporter ATP-binding protein [Streptomonospora sp. PA3]MUL44316.1 ABC transporter ATP-binding protein [Streptomonospora sp. PA3]